ncbi:hypothetical protein [Paenibacillus larvae]|uniref:Uncharacterized protein n=1 Tax=Paenibacillus larvae subsp. larvae TaxID=147375 RepID=A0A6C0QXN1_9BACL|nr:hypothetical protein [Paenibacillus larvae]QHZ53271.1 hypothetical protein ERICV_04210 [Paenibacillus larvae subsp. larvae]
MNISFFRKKSILWVMAFVLLFSSIGSANAAFNPEADKEYQPLEDVFSA